MIAKQAGFSLNEEEKAACQEKLNQILRAAQELPEVEEKPGGLA